MAFHDEVRRRPGMHVGDTGNGAGALQMVQELLSNSLDQHLIGRCSRIEVVLDDDGVVTVIDDGPGIAEPARWLEQLYNQPTPDGHRPHVQAGFHGVGLAAVNALSERLELDTVHAGVRLRAAYSCGELVEPWLREPTSAPSGTIVRMRIDRSIFSTGVPRAALDAELEVLAYLLPQLAFGRGHDGKGLAVRVAMRAGCTVADVAHAVETLETPSGPIRVEVAIARGDGHVESFVNLRPTCDHGRHVDGLFDGVRRVLGPDQRDRIVAAVAVVLADVHFGGPSRDQLTTQEVRTPVADVTERALRASRLLCNRRPS
jgi:DNA gyrase subunit B